MTVGAEKRSDSRPSGTTTCQSGTIARTQNYAEIGKNRPKPVVPLCKAVLPLVLKTESDLSQREKEQATTNQSST